MVRKFLLILVSALVVFGLAQTSQAVLTAVGPIDPSDGFPVYYTDPAALSLVPCLTENPTAPAANPFCVILADPFFDAVNPVVFTSNFPIEFFYWIADADARGGLAPNVKVARFALEGTFANLPTVPVDGLQTVFQRIRFVFTAPSIGTYTITHPFSATPLSFTATTAGQLIKYTLDVPLGIPLNFTTALTGQIGPFLKWDAGLPLLDTAVPPNQYIGNPTVLHTVTGGPFGNSVTVAGPNIGGPGVNSVTTNLFLVAGKVWNGLLPSGLTIKRATYSRTPANAVELDVFATGDLGATVTYRNGSAPPDIPMAKDPIDALSARFFGKNNPVAPPAFVTVTSAGTGLTTTVRTKTVTDLITVTRADYSTSCKKLVIDADSSDELAPIPTLTATGFGALSSAGPALVPPSQRLTVSNIQPPAQVTVTSPKGGSATELVTVFANIPPVALNDTVTTVINTATVINVLANDTDLDGTINPATVAIVTSPTLGTVAVNPVTGAVTYTANGIAGTDTFTYTVKDNPCAGSTLVATSNVATVTVTVLANLPPVAVNDALTVSSCTAAPCTATSLNVLANDTGVGLTVASVTQPPLTAGTVAINVPATSVAFTPVFNFTGVTTFTYVATNGTQLSNAATVTVTVNDIPRAVNDTAATALNTPVVINLVQNDVDLFGGINPASVVASAINPATSGTLQVGVPSAGLVTFTPALNFTGTVTFTYTVADTLGAVSNVATVTVTVNTGPTAVNDTATTTSNVPVTINVLANDLGGAAAVSSITQPAVGTGSVVNNGTSVTYSPGVFTGTATFTYVARNAVGALSNSATVTVTVNAAPVPETIVINTANYKTRGSNWTVNGTSTQRVGNTMTIRLTRTGQLIGTATVLANGSWSFASAGSPVVAIAGDTVTVTSTFGNTATRTVKVQ